MKLLSTYAFREAERNRLERMGYEVLVFGSEADLVKSDQKVDADVIVANHRTLQVDFLEKCKRLRWVQVPHAGIERLNMDYLRDRGIIVINARGAFGVPIAEDILCKMLMLSRNSRSYFRNQTDHRWNSVPGAVNLSGKTVGIIGTGDVGTQTAIRAKAFGMKTVGLNTTGDRVLGFDEVYAQSSLHELIRKSDYIVLTCPLTERTKGMLASEEFALMKPTVFIINISRGALIDESVLLDSLRDGRIAGAALDVFQEEFSLGRLPSESLFWDLDNIVITPHQAGGGDQFYQQFMEVFVLNAEHFMQGDTDKMQNVRDYSKGY